jgi:serine/threonine-protein kinase
VVGELELVRELGRGGVGVVFEARHRGTGALRALKLLAPQEDPEWRERFLREGEAQARVDAHPNVVSVHSAGEASGWLYLELDLAAGGDLAAQLRKGPLPPDEVVRLARDLAAGLEHVHAHGVLHRDLKPANVLFAATGRPMLVDFGLARIEGAVPLTQTGALLGTPSYMAPEQVGSERKELGTHTDVYGLGALLYCALTGRAPFEGPLMAVLSRVASDPPPPPSQLRPELPRAVDAVFARALAKRPSERPPSPSALTAELADALASRGGGGRRAGLGVAAAVVLLGLAAVGLGGLGGEPGPNSEEAAPQAEVRLSDVVVDAPDGHVYGRAHVTGRAGGPPGSELRLRVDGQVVWRGPPGPFAASVPVPRRFGERLERILRLEGPDGAQATHPLTLLVGADLDLASLPGVSGEAPRWTVSQVLRVARHERLRLAAGTTLTFSGAGGIDVVGGVFLAEGEAGRPVTLTGESWKGVVVRQRGWASLNHTVLERAVPQFNPEQTLNDPRVEGVDPRGFADHETDGGGLRVRTGSTLLGDHLQVFDCQSSRRGGGLSVVQGGEPGEPEEPCRVRLERSTLARNLAGVYNRGWGGGIFARGRVEVELVDCVLRENRADFGAGLAMRAVDETGVAPVVTATDTRFEGNTSGAPRASASSTPKGGAGAGVYAYDGRIWLEGCTFQGNRVDRGYGGGAFFQAGYLGRQGSLGRRQVDLVDCQFAGNEVGDGAGGGLAAYDLHVAIAGGAFAENTSSAGGAIALLTVSPEEGDRSQALEQTVRTGLTCERTRFRANRAVGEHGAGPKGLGQAGGGALWADRPARLELRGCTLAGNRASGRGGALRLLGEREPESLVLERLTLVDNAATRGDQVDTRGVKLLSAEALDAAGLDPDRVVQDPLRPWPSPASD